MTATPFLGRMTGFLMLVLLVLSATAQPTNPTIARFEAELSQLDAQADSIRLALEDAKLSYWRGVMREVGFPTEDAIEHSAMFLSYDEAHEQARWVMHVIAPDVTSGSVGRTNDFRPDPKVATGSAVEEDYFLKTLQADGSFAYDGFGFDRGHLAPSADFRWSFKALSESYFYSNMSPQRAEFNRGAWAELEDALRAYLYRNPGHYLLVMTVPVLNDQLPKIERSLNGVSIPETYVKVAFDPETGAGIAFAMPNVKIDQPLVSFAISIDEAEALTNFNFFPKLEPTAAEATFTPETWFTETQMGDVEPLYAPDLPRGHFNTRQAALHMGSNKEVIVCGTVVGSRTARSGNVWLNLDRQYPNQIFSVYIKQEHLMNFSYNPEEDLKGQVVCIKGQVIDLGGTPTMRIEREKQLTITEMPE